MLYVLCVCIYVCVYEKSPVHPTVYQLASKQWLIYNFIYEDIDIIIITRYYYILFRRWKITVL